MNSASSAGTVDVFLSDAFVQIIANKTVRKHAKQRELKYHCIFDQLIENRLLANDKAIATLQKLPVINPYYLLSKELSDEIAKRVALWRDENLK